MDQPDPLRDLFDRARERRIPMAAICKRAGVDPTTPSRWRRGINGANLDKVQQLNSALTQIILEDVARTKTAREAA
jgi:transposase-like protein